MAVRTMDQLVAAMTGGYRMSWHKIAASISGPQWNSYWAVAGRPGAGAVPPSGAGAVPTNATAGALPFVNPSGGNRSYLLGIKGFGGSGGTINYLYDRLVHTSGLSPTATTAQTINSAAVNRPDNTGAGTELFIEIYATLSNQVGVTVNYTNQSGVAGQVSSSVSMGGGISGVAGMLIPVPLAPGDTGVRSVQSLTLSSSAGAGNFGITIARKIAVIPAAGGGLAGTSDPFACGMARLDANACPWLVGYGGGGFFAGMMMVGQG